MYRGHVTHELMHVLGWMHEHQRVDRNSYLRVLQKNIIEGSIILSLNY